MIKPLFSVIILFALCACFAVAQNKHLPIIEEGKTWTGKKWGMNVVTGVYDTLSDLTISIGDKIVINDTLATKINVKYTNRESGQISSGLDLYAFEEDGRLYICDCLQYKNFVQVLDFNYSVGDTITRSNEPYFVVKRDEIANINGIERQILNVSDLHASPPNYWIEGIGAYNSSSLKLMTIFPYETYAYFEIWITGCYKDGECIFSEDWLKEYSVVREVGVDVPAAKPERQQIYDVYGRRVTNPQRGSIYIVDGRKVVWQD